MSVITTRHVVDEAGLDALRASRTDVVLERPLVQVGPGEETAEGPWAQEWEAERGPFRRYRRCLGPPRPAPTAGMFEVDERIEARLAIPLWWPLFNPLMKRALRSPDRTPRLRWWWPREVVSAQTSQLVAAVCVLSVMSGYLGVLIGQTITFAAADFGAGDAAQANTLAAVRVGVLLPLVLLRRADRVGRRPVVLGFATAAIVFTMVGALAPNLAALGAAQTIARGLTTGLATLLVLAATEEVPGTVRAFSISLIAVAAALGAGMMVWVLPVADLVSGGWRIVYLVPALFLPLLWWIGRHLPETQRFRVASREAAPARINRRRLLLIGATGYATALFASPASQLRNEFLRDDLGYSATDVTLFQLVVSTPAGLMLVVAGVAADRVGRRWIGATGVALGAGLSALSYQLVGPPLWLAASGGVIMAGAAFPAMRGYQTELFPTRARAKVGGLLDGVAVAGSATGLITVGYLAERWDDLGRAIGMMVFAPVAVAVVIVVLFPETASQELEVFNPDDPHLDGPNPSPDDRHSSGPGPDPAASPTGSTGSTGTDQPSTSSTATG
jgi:MFS family permease